MAIQKITADVIANSAVTADSLADTTITAAKLHTTLDLTGKTVTVATASAGDNDTTVASTAFVSTAIANLADSAPSTLDTLNELAAALGDDANFSTTVTNSIATKLPLAGGTMTGNIAHASDFTLDVGGDINLDADGGEIFLKDGGTTFGELSISGGQDFVIQSSIADKDILFVGTDGASIITALTLDMSNAGKAIFNAGATFTQPISFGTYLPSDGKTITVYESGNIASGIGVVSGVYRNFTDETSVLSFGHYAHSDGTTYSERMRIDTNGNVGINTTTIPHGGVGYAKFAIDGTNANAAGPHVQYTTSTDNYPVLQQLNWSHDNISLNFDSYYDGQWRSSDAGSNFQIYKNADLFTIKYDSSIAAGSELSWNVGLTLNTAGNLAIGASTALDNKLEVNGGDIRVRGTSTPSIKFNNADQEVVGLRLKSGATGVLSFHTDKMVIDSSGKVGIGQPAPATKLHVYGTDPVIRVSDDSTSGFSTLQLMQQNTSDEGSELMYDSGTGHTHLNTVYGADLKIATNTGSFGTTSTNIRLTVKSDGEIHVGKSGVGTDRIKFVGNTNVFAPNTGDHTQGTRLTLYDANTTSWYAIGIESNHMWFNADEGAFKFYTQAVQKVHFDGSEPMPRVRVGPTASNAMRLGSVTAVLPYSGPTFIRAIAGASYTVHNSTNTTGSWLNLNSSFPDFLTGLASINTINTSQQANIIFYLNTATKVYMTRNPGWNSVSTTGWDRIADRTDILSDGSTNRVYVRWLQAGTHSLDNDSALYFFEAPIGP
jgi:hypothetical protein